MKRREFIKNFGIVTGAGIASFSFAGIPINAFARPLLNINSPNGKILVIIQLKGGNDGINTVIPYDQYSIYKSKRPTLAVQENQLVKLTEATRLHPALTSLKQFFDNGRLSIIQNVGYANQNRSHFRSTDIWLSASDADKFVYDGWVGRYLSKVFPEYPNTPPPHPMAIQLGSVQSMLFDSQFGSMGISFQDPNNFYQLVYGSTVDNDPPPSTLAGDELKYLKQIASLSIEYSTVIKEKADKGAHSTVYNGGNLGAQLKIVSNLILGGLDTPVYLVTLNGFDTHANQADTHQSLLNELAEAVASFQNDLKLQGIEDKVLTMTFSEFGRRVTENGSQGTDHGAALPIFVIGKNVNGGIIGDNPNLNDLDSNGDIKFVYDFRQVYSTVMTDYFQLSKNTVSEILFNEFNSLPFINLTTDIKNSNELPSSFVLNQNYPNPFNPTTTINYSIPEPAYVKLQVFDGLGSLVATLVDEYKFAGSHNSQLSIINYQLSSGIYYYRLSAGEFVQTKKMTILK